MNTATAIQRPSYKGEMPLTLRPHVGVIAFGNAIGNSIIGEIQKSDYEKRQQSAQLKAMSRIANQGASDVVNGVVRNPDGSFKTDALTQQLHRQSLITGNSAGAQAAAIASSLVNTVSVNNSVRDVSGFNMMNAGYTADIKFKESNRRTITADPHYQFADPIIHKPVVRRELALIEKSYESREAFDNAVFRSLAGNRDGTIDGRQIINTNAVSKENLILVKRLTHSKTDSQIKTAHQMLLPRYKAEDMNSSIGANLPTNRRMEVYKAGADMLMDHIKDEVMITRQRELNNNKITDVNIYKDAAGSPYAEVVGYSQYSLTPREPGYYPMEHMNHRQVLSGGDAAIRLGQINNDNFTITRREYNWFERYFFD